FVELASIRRTEIRREPRRALADEVEDAPAVLHAARARLGREARVDVPEQPLEDEARVRFRRHGGRRTAPRNAVGVRARIAGIAVADRARVVASELERREARVRGEMLRRDLIDRD